MFRHCLPALVVLSLLAASPHAAAAQTSARASAKASPSTGSAGVVNINTASANDLEGLPGIGAKTAARIVEYRQKNGPFKKVEELMNVQGIGEKNFLKLKAQVSVAGKPEGATALK
jgi:competence protein ComEA